MAKDQMTGITEDDSLVIRHCEGEYMVILERWYSEYQDEFYTGVSAFKGNDEIYHSGMSSVEFSLESAKEQLPKVLHVIKQLEAKGK